MNKNERASLSVVRILIITLILVLTLGITVVFGFNISSVKIVFSNNYEMEVLTTKTKVSEILEECHIVVLPEETVIPNLDSQIASNKTIIISKVGDGETELTKLAEENPSLNIEQLLGNYSPIVEKIVVEQVVIPFETITKNVANDSENTTNKVLQNGKDGLKEVTYKVKYQNDIEIERTVIEENIIEEPIDKIVQVRAQVITTSRGEVTRTPVDIDLSNALAKKVEGKNPVVRTLNASAYCACTKCCGKSNGITASGAKATAWYTVAAGKGYPLGTIIYIPALKNKPNGGWFVVQDRGGAISDNKLDVFCSTHNEALQFGRKNLECYIYVP